MTFVHREVVRFRDCDPMGHLNNAVFSTYLEQARLAYFGAPDRRRRHGGGGSRTLASPAPRSGAHERAESAAKRSGRSGWLIGYDYERNESTPVPEGWKRRLAQ